MKLTLEIDFADLLKIAGLTMDKPVQVLSTLDTTGSMYGCLDEARSKGCSLVDTIFTFPGAEFGFIGHGDYEDEFDARSYATRGMPFTRNKQQAKDFIKKLPPTCGYDFAECYERVLAEGLEFAWKAGTRKLLVMFGDATPHPANYRYNTKKYDWRKLAREYKKRGIQIIAVQCLNRPQSTSFYNELATLGGGVHTHLHRFEHLKALVVGALARTGGNSLLDAVEAKIREELGGRVPYDLADIYADLAGRNHVERTVSEKDMEPVDSARFQSYQLGDDETLSLKEFVASRNLSAEFDNGKGGFKTGLIYNLVDEAMRGKAEIRPNHRVVLHHKPTGLWYGGDAAREKLGVPRGTSKKLAPHPLGDDWEVWKQSTSSNRKMMPRTRVLVDIKS